MSKRTLYLLGILATIIIGTYLFNIYCCSDCCKEESQKEVPAFTDSVEPIDFNTFKISGNGFNYSSNANFKFLADGFNNVQPVNDSINMGIGQLKTNFDQNLKQKLVITGYALSTEKNTSAFPNLGLARANDVKNYFVSKGFAADRFETVGEIRDSWKVNKDTILGPVDFKIVAIEAVADKAKAQNWNVLKEKINANPLVLYFKSSKAEIILTTDERQEIADLSRYLDNVPNAKISCVGHTDGTGIREKNMQLGQNRADFAKNYLSKNGINANKIESSSKGPDEPIADNTSAAGKAKNRRTVVTIK